MLTSKNRPLARPGSSPKDEFARHNKVFSERVYYFIVLLIISFVVFVKARLLNFPLERDEGAFAYMARLILDGKSIYVDGLDFKPPGLYLVYALFMGLFGSTPTGIHTSLLLFVPISTLVFYMISRELFTPLTALLSTLSFAALSVSPEFLAHASHATQFITLPLLAGLWCIIRFFRNNSTWLCILSGVCMGITFMMKQPAIMFCLFGGFVFLLSGCFSSVKSSKLTARYAVIFTLGTLIPVLLIMLWLMQSTSPARYWFWNFQYPRQYGTVLTLEEGWRNFRIMFPNVVGNFKAVWLTAFSGLMLIPFLVRKERTLLIIAFLTFFSVLAVLPGFYFRRHYFIVFIPSLAILAGVFLNSLEGWLVVRKKPSIAKIPPAIFTLLVISSIYAERGYFFTEDPSSLSQKVYGENPFAASVEIGRYIRDNSVREDKIFVFGSEPQIYIYADRESVSPVIFTYPLVENNAFAKELQTRVIADLKRETPAYFIYVNIPFSWSAQPGHDGKIFRLISKFLSEKFRLEGYADLIGSKTEYVWGEKRALKPPKSQNSVLIFKRKQ